MKSRKTKNTDKESQSAAYNVAQSKSDDKNVQSLADNRPETAAIQKMQDKINSSADPVQRIDITSLNETDLSDDQRDAMNDLLAMGRDAEAMTMAEINAHVEVRNFVNG